MQIFQVLRLRHQVGKDGAHSGLEMVCLGEVVKVLGKIKFRLIVELVRVVIILEPVMRQHLLH